MMRTQTINSSLHHWATTLNNWAYLPKHFQLKCTSLCYDFSTHHLVHCHPFKKQNTNNKALGWWYNLQQLEIASSHHSLQKNLSKLRDHHRPLMRHKSSFQVISHNRIDSQGLATVVVACISHGRGQAKWNTTTTRHYDALQGSWKC